jgi:hypothetical protein
MSEWGRYTLTISKNGKVFKTIEYENMSGNAMMDESFYWRQKYPSEKGYTIDW